MILLALFLAFAPSRQPVEGCKWEQLTDNRLGLEAWVQRCDFDFRKIDLFVRGNSLVIRYSDGGTPDPVIDVFDRLPNETPEAGLQRIFATRTKKSVASKCKLMPYTEESPRPDVKRYTFVPKVAPPPHPDEVLDPQCGPFGDAPDGIQYFEVHPAARKVLFVRAGQDEPLFDEKTLRLFAPAK
jgi:hypothetical protein